jgi:hypothetical protein
MDIFFPVTRGKHLGKPLGSLVASCYQSRGAKIGIVEHHEAEFGRSLRH